MSEDELRSRGMGDRPDERLSPLVGDQPPRPTAETDDVETTDAVLGAMEAARGAGDSAVEDGLVTGSLDEILLAAISRARGETHGTVLMEELADSFGVDLSPGTVYPRLHELDAEGLVAVHELVQTKQYAISDERRSRERMESALADHLAIATYLAAALEGR